MSGFDIFQLIGTVASLLVAIPIFRGWALGFFSWNHNRKIAKLLKEKNFLYLLKTSDREFLGWLLSRLLIVVALLSVALMFRSVEFDPAGARLLLLLHWIIGLVAYYVAIDAFGVYYRLRKYDKQVGIIRKQLDELGFKEDEKVREVKWNDSLA